MMFRLLPLFTLANSIIIIRKTGPCTVELDTGTVDLTPIVTDNGQPKWDSVVAPGAKDGFSYKPCYNFVEGGTGTSCQDVASCQIQGAGMPGSQLFYYNLGKQETATFVVSGAGDLTLQYIDPIEGRQTVVKLVCGQTTSFTAQGETVSGSKIYEMTLVDSHICPNRAPSTTPITPTNASPIQGGLSGGSVVLIIFFCLLFVYVVGGMVFQYTRREARGLAMLPNKGFWTDFPMLVKDGCQYTYQRLRACCKQ